MSRVTKLAIAFVAFALIAGGVFSPAHATGPRADVVQAADIQAQIDLQVDRQAADRRTVENLLSRPDVRRIAGNAGLDMRRVEAAVGQLSASELAQVAARADEATGVAGGTQTVTITVTTIIIVLLLIIILS
jgi:hypothetical protein